jgi:large repetitive protein
MKINMKIKVIGVFLMLMLAGQNTLAGGPYSIGRILNNFAELTGYGGTGANGAITVAGPANGPTNPYYVDSTRTYLTAAAAASATTLTVASSTGFASGNEVLIIQMLGTTPGLYETRTISTVPNGTSITLTAGLTNAYPTYSAGTSVTQVIVVPQYTTVTINSGGFMSAHPFNGQTGGVLFFRANSNVTINYNATYSGRISVAGLGYSGGAASTAGSGPGGGAVGTGGTNTTPGSGPIRVIAGSGGGGSTGAGAAGGGILMMKVGGTLTVDGNLIADGNAASSSTNGGGGSGGTIAVSAPTITRTSTCGPITAAGGAGNGTGTAGGGGRVFLNYQTTLNCTNATPTGVYSKYIVK